MSRCLSRRWAVVVFLVVVGCGRPAKPTAAVMPVPVVADAPQDPEPPLAGRWKWKDVANSQEITLALLQIEAKNGKTIATILPTPLFPLDLQDVRIDEKSIHFTFKSDPGLIRVDAVAADGDAKPQVLRGSLQLKSKANPVVFERTEVKEVELKDARKPGPALEALRKALELKAKDKKALEPALQDVLKKFPGTGAAYAAAVDLLSLAVEQDAKDDDLRAAAEQVLKAAAVFGAPVERGGLSKASKILAEPRKVSPVALEYADKFVKDLTPDDSLEHILLVLKTQELVLRKTGQLDKATKVAVRIGKVETQMDDAFEKTSVPFRTKPFGGRPIRSARVAVVELFTGAQCPPCIAADVAFDAALKTYKPYDVVLLQYHLHIPGFDPLTNLDAIKRQEYYDDHYKSTVGGTPTTLVNGTPTPGLGGYKPNQENYEQLRKLIEPTLETQPQVSLSLNVERKGDQLDVRANVADLKKPGDKIRLRFVVIEDEARYLGGNAQRLHHHVVRAMPGGVAGFALKEAKEEQKVTVSLDELRKSLTAYLTSLGHERLVSENNRLLELKHLKIVALIQDDETMEILQAAQVDVPEAK